MKKICCRCQEVTEGFLEDLRVLPPQSNEEMGEGNSASTFTWRQNRRNSPGLLIEVAMHPLNLGVGYSELMFTDKCKGKRLWLFI